MLMDNSIAHTLSPCGHEPLYKGMSPGLGWLTHTSDHILCLDRNQRQDVVIFDTQGACKGLHLSTFKAGRGHQFVLRRLSWTERRFNFLSELRPCMIVSHDYVA